MGDAIINKKLLKSRMALCGITGKELASVQNWSPTTTYRKINGRVAFTAPEIQTCVELLSLDPETAGEIFLLEKCRK